MLAQASSGVFSLGETDEPPFVAAVPMFAFFEVCATGRTKVEICDTAKAFFEICDTAKAEFWVKAAGCASVRIDGRR